MMHLVGLELERAKAIFEKETGAIPEVEKTSPPRGLPCEEGVWRVVRVDRARSCVTAAFFPLPREGGEGER